MPPVQVDSIEHAEVRRSVPSAIQMLSCCGSTCWRIAATHPHQSVAAARKTHRLAIDLEYAGMPGDARRAAWRAHFAHRPPSKNGPCVSKSRPRSRSQRKRQARWQNWTRSCCSCRRRAIPRLNERVNPSGLGLRHMALNRGAVTRVVRLCGLIG